jgi:pilus assembly protein CpaB
MLRSLRRRLARIGRWPRLIAAGICLVLAVSSALDARRGSSRRGASAPVVVATRPLPAGHVITRHDIAVRRWPTAVRPGAARAGPSQVLGRRLAGPVTAREPITSTRLLGNDLTTGLHAGEVATPVVVDDAHLSDLVHAGDLVDLIATPRTSDPPAAATATDLTTVARRVVVLAVLPGSADVLAAPATELILAVARDTATRITRLRSTQVFTALADPP